MRAEPVLLPTVPLTMVSRCAAARAETRLRTKPPTVTLAVASAYRLNDEPSAPSTGREARDARRGMLSASKVVPAVYAHRTEIFMAAQRHDAALNLIPSLRIASRLPAARERRHSPTVATALKHFRRTDDVLENLIEGVAA